MQVPRPSTLHVLGRKVPRPKEEVLEATEKVAIKMCDIVKEVLDEAKKTFLWFDIFLTTHMTIKTNYLGAAIQAVLAFSLWMV